MSKSSVPACTHPPFELAIETKPEVRWWKQHMGFVDSLPKFRSCRYGYGLALLPAKDWSASGEHSYLANEDVLWATLVDVPAGQWQGRDAVTHWAALYRAKMDENGITLDRLLWHDDFSSYDAVRRLICSGPAGHRLLAVFNELNRSMTAQRVSEDGVWRSQPAERLEDLGVIPSKLPLLPDEAVPCVGFIHDPWKLITVGTKGAARQPNDVPHDVQTAFLHHVRDNDEEGAWLTTHRRDVKRFGAWNALREHFGDANMMRRMHDWFIASAVMLDGEERMYWPLTWVKTRHFGHVPKESQGLVWQLPEANFAGKTGTFHFVGKLPKWYAYTQKVCGMTVNFQPRNVGYIPYDAASSTSRRHAA